MQCLKEYIEKDGFDIDLVKLAIDKGADGSKRNFGYINAILKNWRQNGIKTVAQQEEETKEFQNKKDKYAGGSSARNNTYKPDPREEGFIRI